MFIFKTLILIILTFIIIYLLNKILYKFNLSSFARSEKHHIHNSQIYRIGGIFFILSLFILVIINLIFNKFFFDISSINFLFLLFLTTFFIIGLIDDFFIVNNRIKFIILFIMVVMVVLLFDLKIYGLIESLNLPIQILLSVFCLFVLIVSFNLIDGLNGLLILYSLICITNLFFINIIFTGNFDPLLLFVLISLFICLFFNFPIAKFFMGDGAAYAIAFVIGYYSLKTHSMTTGNINEWFFGCLLAYPVMELLFSLSRRILDKKSIFDPDKKHFHSILYYLINKKYYLRHDLSNPLATSFLIFLMITFNTITLYYLFNDQGNLKYLFFSFCVLYLVINYLFLKIYKNVTIL